jgi:hypothetical protein
MVSVLVAMTPLLLDPAFAGKNPLWVQATAGQCWQAAFARKRRGSVDESLDGV